MTIFKENLRENVKQDSWQMQISALSLLSSLEATARYGYLGKKNAPSSWLWQFLSPEGPLMAQPGDKEPSECHLEKALLLQHYHHQNQQAKNTFRKKRASLVLNSRAAENAMEKFSLLYCDTRLANTATKILHQIL